MLGSLPSIQQRPECSNPFRVVGSAISVLTLLSVFIWKCVDPIHWMLDRLAAYAHLVRFRSSRACTASRMASPGSPPPRISKLSHERGSLRKERGAESGKIRAAALHPAAPLLELLTLAVWQRLAVASGL